MTDPGGLERYLDAVTVEARALMDGFEGPDGAQPRRPGGEVVEIPGWWSTPHTWREADD